MLNYGLRAQMMGGDAPVFRFGVFELDTAAEQLRKNGVTVRLQPQPYKLLRLLVESYGRVVPRDAIRSELWPGDTYVDFDQGVNFAIKQVREALGDDAERALYIQTVPKRGYRFIAPVDMAGDEAPTVPPGGTDLRLHKALWANIVELRLAEERRLQQRKKLVITGVAVAAAVAVALVVWLLLRSSL